MSEINNTDSALMNSYTCVLGRFCIRWIHFYTWRRTVSCITAFLVQRATVFWTSDQFYHQFCVILSILFIVMYLFRYYLNFSRFNDKNESFKKSRNKSCFFLWLAKWNSPYTKSFNSLLRTILCILIFLTSFFNMTRYRLLHGASRYLLPFSWNLRRLVGGRLKQQFQ